MVAGSTKKPNKKVAAKTAANSSNTSITATTETSPSPPKTPPSASNQIKVVETPSPAIPEEGIPMQSLNPASKYDTSFNNTPADTNNGFGYKVEAEGEGKEDSPTITTSTISKTPQETNQNLTTTEERQEEQEEGGDEEEEEEEMLKRKLPVKTDLPVSKPPVPEGELPLWLSSTIWIMIFPVALLWCFSVDLLRRILRGLF